MNNQSEKPIEELLRGIPQDHRICIPFQWAEDGRETGHHYIPVGRHVHQAADKITALREQLKKVNKDRLESHIRWDAENAARIQAEAKIATLREALSRLVEVHDAMGGMCSPERILAEAALAKEEGK